MIGSGGGNSKMRIGMTLCPIGFQSSGEKRRMHVAGKIAGGEEEEGQIRFYPELITMSLCFWCERWRDTVARALASRVPDGVSPWGWRKFTLFLPIHRELRREIQRAFAFDMERQMHLAGCYRGKRDPQRMNAGFAAHRRLVAVANASHKLEDFS